MELNSQRNSVFRTITGKTKNYNVVDYFNNKILCAINGNSSLLKVNFNIFLIDVKEIN